MTKYRIMPYRGTYIIQRKLGIFQPWLEVIQIMRPIDYSAVRDGKTFNEFRLLSNMVAKALVEIKKADKKLGI